MAAPVSSDQLLVSRIRAGEADAWSELIARFEGRLLAFVEGRLGRRSAGEDVVQETFLGFLNSLPNYEDARPLEGLTSFQYACAQADRPSAARRPGAPALPFPVGSSGNDWEPPARGRAVSSMMRSHERRGLEQDAIVVAAFAEQIERLQSRGRMAKARMPRIAVRPRMGQHATSLNG